MSSGNKNKNSQVVIRVRSKAGVWRVPDVDLKSNLQSLMDRVSKEQGVVITKASTNPNLSTPLTPTKTLKELGLTNGSFLYVQLGEGIVTVGGTRREIDAQGNVITKEVNDKGFLPGLQALGDQKQAWTLTEMNELEKKYTFTIKGDKEDLCSKASLDFSACESFTKYIVQKLGMKQCRCGILFGRYVDSDTEKNRRDQLEAIEKRNDMYKGSYGSTKANMRLADLENKISEENKAKTGVLVESIYEPEQTGTDIGFTITEDIINSSAYKLAKELGLDIVGLVVSRPNKEEFKDINLTANEVIHGAEISLDANQGKRTSPFVVVRVIENSKKEITFEPFSLTSTCLDMVAEGALALLEKSADKNDRKSDGHYIQSHCSVVAPFTAIVEGKAAHAIDTDFFIKSVPIANHDSTVFSEKNRNEFPRLHRTLNPAPTQASLGAYLKSIVGGKKSLADEDVIRILSNFHVLVYLAGVFGIHPDKPNDAMTSIAHWTRKYVLNDPLFKEDISLKFPDGYKAMIQHAAGLA